jgi:hypothetical protein
MAILYVVSQESIVYEICFLPLLQSDRVQFSLHCFIIIHYLVIEFIYYVSDSHPGNPRFPHYLYQYTHSNFFQY